MLRLSFMVLFLTIGASGQETPIKAPQRAVPLSCTSKVESSACKWTKGAFSSAQTTSTRSTCVQQPSGLAEHIAVGEKSLLLCPNGRAIRKSSLWIGLTEPTPTRF